MTNYLKEIYSVAWGDLCFIKHTWFSVLVMSIMSPLLYLLAFGYGMGDGREVEGISYIAFIIPGIAALTTLSSSFSSTSTRLNVQRLYYRSFDEMMMCPIHYISMIIGKAMIGVIRGMISALIIYSLGYFLADELTLNPLLFVFLILSCFIFALLGVTAALLAKSHQSMATFSSLIILPMTFLCGTFFSVDAMPSWFQGVLYALPLTHSSEIIRAAALDWSIPWISVLVLCAFGIAFMVVDLWLIKNRKI